MENRVEGCGLDSSGSDIDVGSCERGNKTLGSLEGREFLD
jgi:hypothetical protein